MSETIRSYTSGSRGRRSRRKPVFRYVFLALFLAVLLWAGLVTRNTHDAGDLVPAGQQYELFVSDLLGGREAIAGSSLWDIAPESLAAPELRENLRNDFGIPAWVLNNYTLGPFHISGNSLPGFDDALVVSRITRVGCMLERFRGWSNEIEEDYAGGLRLRHVPAAGFYYAIRGRILAASRSRDTLVRALTLLPGEALGQERIDEATTARRDEIAHARILCEGWPAAAEHFEAAEARVWLSGNESRLWIAGRLTEGARTVWAPLLADARPARLPAAAPGPLQLSVNLGKPLPLLADAVAQMYGVAEFDPQGLLAGMFPEAVRPLAATAIGDFASHLGSGWSLTWRGMNAKEMVPMPLLAAVFETDAAWAGEWVGDFPAPPESVQPWESWPRPAESPARVYVPAVAGPDFEPTLAPYGAGLLLATSHPDALEVLNEAAAPAWRDEQANLLLRIEPETVFNDLMDAGRELARAGLIRGMDAAAFDAFAEKWAGLAGRIEMINAMAQHEDGVITLDLRLQTRE